jgi:hypothetical protein
MTSQPETVKNKSIYDNAKNHFLGNFPQHLPIEQAYVHIGIYLGWVIDNNLYSEYFEEEADTQIYRFSNRQINCTILSEIWDGYLGHELFSDEGNLFTYYYYGGGLYHKDYVDILAGDLPSIYHVSDEWPSYEKMSEKISERYTEWKNMIS